MQDLIRELSRIADELKEIHLILSEPLSVVIDDKIFITTDTGDPIDINIDNPIQIEKVD